ncbi:MAG: PAS domain S-box protein [Terriglobales bacterium]
MMPPLPHPALPLADRERHWQKTAAAVAVLTGAVALVSLPLAAVWRPWPPALAVAVVAAALAVAALAPLCPFGSGRGWRWGGHAAAALVFALGVLAPLSGPAAFALIGLAVSLVLKRWWPHVAVVADLLVAFVADVVVLDYVFDSRHVLAHAPMSWEAALALLVLTGAWMAAWPRLRPVAFYLESGAAAAVLRRLLPITLLYPIALVWVNAARSHGQLLAARLAQYLLVYGTVALGIVLFWLIARELDRRDTMAHLASLELRASEQRYRQQFENNPQPMWIFSIASLRFLAVNDSAVREFGYSREEFLTMSVLDIRPEEDHARVRAVVGNGQPANGWLWRYRTRSDELIEAEVFAQPIDWHGEPAFMSFIHDVTARRRAEQQLREQEEQVRTLLESTSEGIYTVDLEGRCLWCNPAAAAQLGWRSSAGLVGKSVHQVAHHTRANGQPFPATECALVRSIHAGEAISLDEETMYRCDGSHFPADVRSSPLYRGGQLVGAVVVIADVSERSSLRAQFQQAQKMEAVGRLAAGVAHDFNNLLTVINGYTDMLLAQPEIAPAAAPQQRAKVTSIRRAGERAVALTQQLLAFSRQQVAEPRLLDLNAVLVEMDPLLRRVLGEDLELATVCDPRLGAVRADPGQVSQVLMNLVVNARDAMPHGGRITIETDNVTLDARYAAHHPEVAPGDYVMLAVSDTGSGMDAETQSHIFEPFFTTKPVGKGTGLGLATVFGIVKQSGGSLAVYSEPGRGTAMKVYLPRLAGTAAPAPRPAAPATSGRETILLVEDEAAVRELVEEVLGSRGYRVLVAARPSEALARARQQHGALDLLITDMVMPEMDGRRLAAELARQQPELAVLYVSGYPDQAAARHHQLEPEAGFLQKPFTPEALAAKVRTVLDARRAPARAAAS